MRRIVMFNRVTANGCFAGADDGLDWVVPDPEVDREGAAGIPQTDAVLLGRKTYQMFESFWPRVLEQKSPENPHAPGQTSPEMRDFAVGLNAMTKWVFSKTLPQATWNNSRLVRDLDANQIRKMKDEPGKDMIVLGSGSIVSQLTQHGLIDEYTFVVSPVLVGNGRRLLNDVSNRVKLQLVETKTFPSGNLKLHYRRA